MIGVGNLSICKSPSFPRVIFLTNLGGKNFRSRKWIFLYKILTINFKGNNLSFIFDPKYVTDIGNLVT